MKKFILLGFILMLLTLAVHAQEDGAFGISVDCVVGCDGKEINISKDILLEFTIANDRPYWISFGEKNREDVNDGSSISLEVYHKKLKGGKDGEYYRDILGPGFFIKPDDELKVYLPFYIYNEMNEDSRVGEWIILPKIELDSLKYYSSDFSEMKYSGPIKKYITGNELKFRAVKPEVKVNTAIEPEEEVKKEGGLHSIPRWITESIREIFVAVIAIIIGSYAFHKYILQRLKKRKR